MGFFARTPETACQPGTYQGLEAIERTPKLKTTYAIDHAIGHTTQARCVVISGRMADVCAELDRLIQLEAQPFLH